MRKIFQSAIAAILICGLSVLTACSNDDETIVVPPQPPPPSACVWLER